MARTTKRNGGQQLHALVVKAAWLVVGEELLVLVATTANAGAQPSGGGWLMEVHP